MLAASFYCPHCGAANDTQATECFACGHTLSGALAASLDGASPSTSGSLPQVLLRQRYRVLAQVGKGGFGAVYKAADTQLGHRVVAIKEMSHVGLTAQELAEATESFQREAMLLASMKHANLPRVYDQFSEEGRWYLVMEYIEGETLETMLDRRGGRLPLAEALHLAQELCSALEYLHTRQPPVIFRDLKPSNVMLTPDKQLFLIDFGIARHFKPGQAKDTIAFGSPGYAAPEQYGKAQTTQRADVYGLGALLHQLITGDDPSDVPFRFAPLPPVCPAALQRLMQRMVDLDEQKRPESMIVVGQELSRVIDTLAGGQWSSASAALPAVTKAPTVSPKTKEQWLEDGNDHCAAERYETALAAFNVALQLDPDYGDAYINKGVALHGLHQYSEAITTYRRGLQLNPDDASAYQNLGLSLSALKRNEEALEAYDRAIQLHPTRVKAYTCKSIALVALKRYEEALTTCDLEIQLSLANADAYAWKGDILVKLKRYGEALLAYERASRLNPSSMAYEKRPGWRRARRKTQQAFNLRYVRRLIASYAVDLIFVFIGLLILLAGSSEIADLNGTTSPYEPSRGVWVAGGVVALLLLWACTLFVIRMDPGPRRVMGVALGLISGTLGWLTISLGLPSLGLWAAALMGFKCLLPSTLLWLSPREVPVWVVSSLSALSFAMTGALFGTSWCGGGPFGMVVGGLIGLSIGIGSLRRFVS